MQLGHPGVGDEVAACLHANDPREQPARIGHDAASGLDDQASGIRQMRSNGRCELGGRPGEAATDVDPLDPELLCEPGQQLRKPPEGP